MSINIKKAMGLQKEFRVLCKKEFRASFKVDRDPNSKDKSSDFIKGKWYIVEKYDGAKGIIYMFFPRPYTASQGPACFDQKRAEEILRKHFVCI